MARMGKQVRGHDSTGHFRLPLDRSFTLRGFGTVVTGTLTSGSVGAEDEVEVHPNGLRLRVRGLQVHGEAVSRAFAGQRTAVNLSGVDASELKRGMTLTAPGFFRPTQTLDAALDLLPSAGALKHGAPIHFHAGTAEVEAEVRLLGEGFVRLLLKEPAFLWPGDRFIIRKFSPVVTIGGGVVLDIEPPRRLRRTASLDRALRLTSGGSISVWVAEAALGLPLAEMVARSGLRDQKLLASLPPELTLLHLPQTWLIAQDRARELVRTIHSILSEFHGANPLQPGMSREELRVRLACPADLLQALLASSKEFTAEGDLLRLTSHKVALAGREDEAVGKMEGLFREAGLAVPAVNHVLAASGIEANKARTLLQMLLRDKRLVRVSTDLIFHAEAVAALRQQIAARRGQRFSVGDFKEWTGISRKYAIPLLEFLDRERITRRDGEQRIVL
jgi:selenocysteine-specific elongation factor